MSTLSDFFERFEGPFEIHEMITTRLGDRHGYGIRDNSRIQAAFCYATERAHLDAICTLLNREPLVERLAKAANVMSQIHDSSRYDEIASRFMDETGIYAPGKSIPAASYAGTPEEQDDFRREKFLAWIGSLIQQTHRELQEALDAVKEASDGLE